MLRQCQSKALPNTSYHSFSRERWAALSSTSHSTRWSLRYCSSSWSWKKAFLLSLRTVVFSLLGDRGSLY
jgi:hypothetical protein